MSATVTDPRRYFEAVGPERERDRCHSRRSASIWRSPTAATCCAKPARAPSRTLEPPADMSWDLFTRIVDQVPDVARVVLHGVGEPMLVKDLPRMVRYLKDRGTYVLFNTNGTLAESRRSSPRSWRPGWTRCGSRWMRRTGPRYARVRGKDFFDRIVRDVGRFTAYLREVGADAAAVSLWLTGLKETIAQLPEFVRLAARMGVREVHLQRLVFDAAGYGMARATSSLFEATRRDEQAAIDAAQALARELGVTLDASGATEPGLSLQRQAGEQPWSACRRPWSLMYFTAHGRALPCCIAPFSARGYDTYTLGDATQQTLREIWNSAAYRDFRRRLLSDAPPAPCQGCGLRWSL